MPVAAVLAVARVLAARTCAAGETAALGGGFLATLRDRLGLLGRQLAAVLDARQAARVSVVTGPLAALDAQASSARTITATLLLCGLALAGGHAFATFSSRN